MHTKETILIVDDDIEVLKVLTLAVERMGYEVLSANDSTSGLSRLVSDSPNIMITDLVMEKMDGIELLQKAKALNPEIMVVVLTGSATTKTAVEAMKHGAIDYIQKPVTIEQIEVAINKALERKRLVEENRELRRCLDNQYKFHNIVGQSEPMRRIFSLIEKVAPTDANVMISGESGTGKELIARAIHGYSTRNDKPFVAVDCVALPTQLIESELFGYEKGAFTGAENKRKGLIEISHSGTFFMDEITEMDFNLQSKLLRILQERQFRRVGGRELLDIDVRLIAATKREPQVAVDEGFLREDLYYRLNVVPIRLPPLRERPEDIPPLVDHFLNSNRSEKVGPKSIAPIVLEMLQNYHWPGNIRELRNMIERLYILACGDEIVVSDLPKSLLKGLSEETSTPNVTIPFKDAKKEYMQHFEREYLQQVLEKFGGNMTKASEASGVNRKTFYRLMIKYKIKKPDASQM